MWVDYKPVDVEIDDDNTGIFHVFEMRIGMNEFDHRILALLSRCCLSSAKVHFKYMENSCIIISKLGHVDQLFQ